MLYRHWFVAVSLFTAVAAAGVVHAEPPALVNYQGKLLDSNGNPISGTVAVDVAIWSDATSVDPLDRLYSESHPTTPVVEGVLELELGGGTGATGNFDAVLFADADRWLEITVDSEPLSPRQPFRSVPYALQATTVSAPSIIDNTPVVPSGGGFGPNHRTPALTINAGNLNGNLTYSLAIHETDVDLLSWLFDDLGGWSHGWLVIDGDFNATIDPDTKLVTISDNVFITDPDGPGTLATMLQLGADVETALIIKGNLVSVNGREPKLLLAVDRDEDWVFKIGNEGDLWWGDPQQKGKNSWDVKLERVEDSGFEHPRFVLDADNPGNEVVVDIKAPLVQGTGAPTHGPAYWAVSDGAAVDNGDTVCQGESLSCQSAIEFSTMADPTQSSCGIAHAIGTTFIAFCK